MGRSLADLTPSGAIRGVRVLAVAAAVVATIALTGPFKYSDLHLPFPDTVAHGMLFYGLCLVMLGALPRSRTFDLALALVAIGAASEVVQSFVGREMSLHDLVGDSCGVAAAVAPTIVQQFRGLVRSHPDVSFAELRRRDRRQGRAAPAVAEPERP